MIMGAVLTAIFIGLAQQMHISEADTRYELCLQEVDRAEWHCRNTGEYPNGTAGPARAVQRPRLRGKLRRLWLNRRAL